MNLPGWMRGKQLIFFYPIIQKNKISWHTINFFLSSNRFLHWINMHAVFSLFMDASVYLSPLTFIIRFFKLMSVFFSTSVVIVLSTCFIRILCLIHMKQTDALSNSINDPQRIWVLLNFEKHSEVAMLIFEQ